MLMQMLTNEAHAPPTWRARCRGVETRGWIFPRNLIPMNLSTGFFLMTWLVWLALPLALGLALARVWLLVFI